MGGRREILFSAVVFGVWGRVVVAGEGVKFAIAPEIFGISEVVGGRCEGDGGKGTDGFQR